MNVYEIKDRRIIRMNSIANALKYFEIKGKKKITVKKVLKVADKFYKYVLGEDEGKLEIEKEQIP